MNRELRNILKVKQDKLNIKRGRPRLSDLSQAVPELRLTRTGLSEYVRIGTTIYQKNYTKYSTDKKISRPMFSYDIHTANFSKAGTTLYLPLSSQTTSESATITNNNEHLTMVPAFNGRIMKIMLRSENAIADGSTALKYEILESSDGTEAPASETGQKSEIVSLVAHETHEMDFGNMDSGTNILKKGKIYAIKLTGPDNFDDTNITIVYRWNIAQIIKFRGSAANTQGESAAEDTSNAGF